jgi:hypothetical protein
LLGRFSEWWVLGAKNSEKCRCSIGGGERAFKG